MKARQAMSRVARAQDAAERPAVDLVHLARQTFGDRELERELLGLFVRQARSVLDCLHDAVTSNGQLPSWGCDPLHALSGSARAVGCWDVAQEAQTLEMAIRAAALAHETLPADQRLDRVAAAIEAASASIRALTDDEHP